MYISCQTSTSAVYLWYPCQNLTIIIILSGRIVISQEHIDYYGDNFIDIFDILMLVDVILGHNENECSIETSDINNDGISNVLDVIILLQHILNGDRQQSIQYLQQILTPAEFIKLTNEYSLLLEPKIIAYPNPSNGNINIIGNGYVTIYDMRGRLVKQINIDGRYIWDTEDISTGIYHIINQTETIKVTVLK